MKHVRSRSSSVLRLAVLLPAVLALAACGRADDERASPSALAGPPMWRLAEGSGTTGTTAFTLQVRTPGRARLRVEANPGVSNETPWRELASGQTVTVEWTQGREAPDEETDTPGPAERGAGRTESHVAYVTFGFRERARTRVRHAMLARPGKGRLLARDVLPPGRYEPLPVETPIELATLIFTDLAAGEAQLRSRGFGAHLTLPAGMTAQDRVEQVRLYLEVELVSQER